MRPKRIERRRGVLLIIILALLAMFALVAVAFVVLTGHAESSAKSIQRVDQCRYSPAADLHQGLMQVLRGPTEGKDAITAGDPVCSSAIGPHSLLEDIYGDAQAGDQFTSVTPMAGGQLVEFTCSATASDDIYRWPGCVLTLVTSQNPGQTPAGQSTHIVGINPQTGNPQFRALEIGRPVAGDTFIVNGVPFAGTGFGYNEDTGELDAEADGYPLALQPYHSLNIAPAGGANEDYDAVDFQNMILGAQIEYDDGATVRVATIPSLLRPALVRYWQNQTGGSLSANPALQRAVVPRPMPQDHFHDANDNGAWDSGEAYFTGSNTRFNAAWDGRYVDSDSDGICDYSWDVDNDGDGTADSIWVDLGMPVRATPDGRLYKPLYAILCVDMDGRLNLNAHGCWAQTQPEYYENIDASSAGMLFAGGSGSTPLARGMGIGPAEINLRELFTTSASPLDMYQQVLVGDGTFEGRYGESHLGTVGPGFAQTPDSMSQNTEFDYWQRETVGDVWEYWDYLNNPGSYYLNAFGSPIDFDGNCALGLDAGGRPLYYGMCTVGEQIDDPYEVDLSRRTARGLSAPTPIDNLFSASELERLLRPFDRDATQLPSRLWYLTDDGTGVSSLVDMRRRITTEGWDIPGPAPVIPKHLRDNLTANDLPKHVTDLLRARGISSDQWEHLLPPEFLAGLKLNINRPFGNGIDDDNDGVVDEPAEQAAGESLALLNSPDSTSTVSATFDHHNDGSPGTDTLAIRQLFARHLYVLAMLVADTDYLDAQDLRPGKSGSAETARYLAQWAVNAVDFRDRDSIMTPFEYDLEPFDDEDNDGNPWDVDGIIGSSDDGASHRGLVWGCERPELLITETLAFHDRRTQDLNTDINSENKYTYDPSNPEGEADDPANCDEDFDSWFRPQGSLFVELHNPWSRLEPRTGDVHGVEDTGYNAGVQLNKTTGSSGSPVWRLIIVDPNASGQPTPTSGEVFDPDDADAGTLEIERAVYFVAEAEMTPPTGAGVAAALNFYPSSTQTTEVEPGGYAVIGPGNDEGRTFIGFKVGNESGNESTRHLSIDPGISSSDGNLVVGNKMGGVDDNMPNTQIKVPAQVRISEPRRLSISEPITGYPSNPSGATFDPATGKYDQALDEPLDKQEQPLIWEDVLSENQTVTGYRYIYLQRLANPLEAFDATTNPYRTIDFQPVDLTSFNGVTDETNQYPPLGASPPSGDGDNVPDASNMAFGSHQRGETEDGLSADIGNLWKQEPPHAQVDDVVATSGNIGTGHYFNAELTHSLGYTNRRVDSGTGGIEFYFGEPIDKSVSAAHQGDPSRPVPWLNWNNRPFVSEMELLLVPTLAQSRLLARNTDTDGEYLYYRFVHSGETPNAYSAGDVIKESENPYPHLVNFLQSGPTSAQMHRLLEYVGVPSRFTGTELHVDPTLFSTGDHRFHPPFNRISLYRDPGRVNLNTIFYPEVLQGLLNYFPSGDESLTDTTPAWDEFVASRRGDAAVGNDQLDLDTTYATRFGMPFRSFGGGEWRPDSGVPKTDADEIEATLMRPGITDDTQPLFSHESQGTPTAPEPDDTDRNPYFRYQALNRLANLVTTRSNVYAVWITVGYFEVESAGVVNDVYPDGYRLGQELGTDTGEVERHRAFYIIDRTIPVGFQRGYDMNTENAILLRRFIE